MRAFKLIYKGHYAVSDENGTRIYDHLGRLIHSSENTTTESEARKKIDVIIKTDVGQGYNRYLDNWAKNFFPVYECLWADEKFGAIRWLNIEMEKLLIEAELLKEKDEK